MNKDIPWRFIISHLKGDVDEKEEKLFCEWLQEERNTLLFRELESLWREIREETSTYTPDTDYYWRQMESRMLRKDEKAEICAIVEVLDGGICSYSVIGAFAHFLLFYITRRNIGRTLPANCLIPL